MTILCWKCMDINNTSTLLVVLCVDVFVQAANSKYCINNVLSKLSLISQRVLYGFRYVSQYRQTYSRICHECSLHRSALKPRKVAPLMRDVDVTKTVRVVSGVKYLGWTFPQNGVLRELHILMISTVEEIWSKKISRSWEFLQRTLREGWFGFQSNSVSWLEKKTIKTTTDEMQLLMLGAQCWAILRCLLFCLFLSWKNGLENIPNPWSFQTLEKTHLWETFRPSKLLEVLRQVDCNSVFGAPKVQEVLEVRNPLCWKGRELKPYH